MRIVFGCDVDNRGFPDFKLLVCGFGGAGSQYPKHFGMGDVVFLASVRNI